MSRSAVRELIRKAQQAELGGEAEQAVQFLEEAAARALEQAEAGCAASLLRHCLRLAPTRADLAERLQQISPPEQPATIGQAFELPPRGPAAADPLVDAWCSFCCRPKAEVGPVVAGPAGVFICAACIQSAARIAAVGSASGSVAAPAFGAAPSLVPEPPAPDFIEAAVRLTRELGWSLQEIRSLSTDERRRALEVLERPGKAGG